MILCTLFIVDNFLSLGKHFFFIHVVHRENVIHSTIHSQILWKLWITPYNQRNFAILLWTKQRASVFTFLHVNIMLNCCYILGGIVYGYVGFRINANVGSGVDEN